MFKEQRQDLCDEVKFLRERTQFLESERDRLTFSLDLTNRRCDKCQSVVYNLQKATITRPINNEHGSRSLNSSYTSDYSRTDDQVWFR